MKITIGQCANQEKNRTRKILYSHFVRILAVVLQTCSNSQLPYVKPLSLWNLYRIIKTMVIFFANETNQIVVIME